ncbi:hypothetical protein M3Y99_00729000 [Aphelenchoides fujianensis]|nr:hypothetical protein M3Y99_00729000 [Aphelenchoides fujianensis]
MGGSWCADCGQYGLCLSRADENSTTSGGCAKCACPFGIGGSCCETRNKTCVAVSAFDFACRCDEGFTGANCDEEYVNCTSYATTLGPSTWAETTENTWVTWLTTEEAENWTQATDERSTTTSDWMYCGDFGCENEGTCAYSSSGVAFCVCRPGFSGEKCEIREGCADNPCQNGGFCSNVNQTDYECACLSLYNGTNCEGKRNNWKIVPCNARPCHNGTCVDLGGGEFRCDCTPGYRGSFCEEIIDMCEPLPCEYNGTCTSLINDFECDCPANTGGKNCSDITNLCESEIYPTVCNANDSAATCSFSYMNFSCSCSAAWAGDYCNITRRVFEVLPYFPNATTDLILFLESIATSATEIQAATAYIIASLDILEEVSWEVGDMFAWTAYEQRDINYTEQFYPTGDATSGRCFTFNHPQSATFFSLRNSGYQNGLSMLVQLKQTEYIEWVDLATMNVFIHPFNQPVFAESLSFDVMPDSVSNFRVAASTFTSLGGHYSHCADTAKDVPAYYFPGNYSSDACMWSCYQSRVYITCGCMDPRYALRRRVAPCTLDDAKCVFSVLKDYGDPSTWGDFCDCPNECTDVQYDVLWDMSWFKAQPVKCKLLSGAAFDACMARYDDQAMIVVYFPDITQTLYEETAKWNINSILSYFGGIAGVVMGFSFISILEAGYLFYRCLLVLCTNEKSTLDELEVASVDDDEEERAKELRESEVGDQKDAADQKTK